MRLLGSCALLAVVIFMAALVVAAIACQGFSTESLICAFLGGGVCCVAACGGLATTYFGSRWHLPVQGILLGMLLRMGLPLAVLIALNQTAASSPVRGIGPTILGVYLIALTLETVLAVRIVMPAAKAQVVIASK